MTAIATVLHALADHLPHDATIRIERRDTLDYLHIHILDEHEAATAAQAAGMGRAAVVEVCRARGEVRSQWTAPGVCLQGPNRPSSRKENPDD